MQNFILNKNRVFQGEIIFTFFHIHRELKLILPLVKIAKKRGCLWASFFAITIGIPYFEGQIKGRTKIPVFQTQIWCNL